jgi:putative glutamine amidotransferase
MALPDDPLQHAQQAALVLLSRLMLFLWTPIFAFGIVMRWGEVEQRPLFVLIMTGVPLLGICRGFQEINVAMGGRLHQTVHAVEGLMDHREPDNVPIDEQYGPSHPVRFEPGSVFEQWAGASQVMVNSLHGQGIGALAPGLRALAHAPDGLVEAFEVEGAQAFAYAVQWHPEWRCWENPFYSAIFRAFGDAVRQRRETRLQEGRTFASTPEKP